MKENLQQRYAAAALGALVVKDRLNPSGSFGLDLGAAASRLLAFVRSGRD